MTELQLGALIFVIFLLPLTFYDIDHAQYRIEDPMSLPPIMEEFYSDVIGHPRLSDKEIIEKYFYIHESVGYLGNVDLETSLLFSFMYERSGKDVIVWRDPEKSSAYSATNYLLYNIRYYVCDYFIDYQHNTYVEDHIDKPIQLKFLEINGKYYTHMIYKEDGKIQVYPDNISILIEVH